MKQRLKYSFIHPRALVNRAIYTAITRLAPAARGSLLDIGCGRKPYRNIFAPYITRHIGIDIPTSMHGRDDLDLAGSALSLPLVSGTFDTVLATEVMEHTPNPERMLEEINRVLVPGGIVILSVPFHEPLHELPYDYYRFTSVSLIQLLTAQGFRVERIERRGGAVLVAAYLLCSFLYRKYGATGYPHALRMRPFRGPLVIGLCSAIQLLAAGLDSIAYDEFDTQGYAVLAQKIN